MRGVLLSLSVLVALVVRPSGACSAGDGFALMACSATLQAATASKVCDAVGVFKACTNSLTGCEDQIKDAIKKIESQCGSSSGNHTAVPTLMILLNSLFLFIRTMM